MLGFGLRGQESDAEAWSDSDRVRVLDPLLGRGRGVLFVRVVRALARLFWCFCFVFCRIEMQGSCLRDNVRSKGGNVEMVIRIFCIRIRIRT